MIAPTYESLLAAWRGKEAAAAYERDVAAFRAELAEAPLEPLRDPEPPARRPRGKNRNRFGRTGPHPAAPKRHAREASWKGAAGEEQQGAAGRAPEPRITVPPEIRSKLQRGAATAVLVDAEPDWQAGQVVPVKRRGQGDERDPVLMLEVQSLEWFEARAIDTHRAQMLGYATLGEFARARYPSLAGNAQFLVRHLQLDERPVWFAVVIRPLAITPWQLDDEHGRPAEGVVAPRWLGPAGECAYTESDQRGLRDAGICVEPHFQEAYSKAAAGSIAVGLVKGVRKSGAAREAGRQLHHADRAREASERRRLRNLDRRRQEATPEEVALFMVGRAA